MKERVVFAEWMLTYMIEGRYSVTFHRHKEQAQERMRILSKFFDVQYAYVSHVEHAYYKEEAQ
ncbi:hypothetical protein M2323_004686 [Rhodoblastus acidophilus]|uniref:hypothetical protein n=1 Tax=Rhodoblastus acidophilus TaxID=1074 RepID=UPI002224ACBF|nr:hypothetical protein [Rhodoblastus acidophilus]MCW2286873.1 hypothetical protein [Rhodoblastus acidophilus]MCW2335730.1 hypothetical protein [Rhodoblastus acidophilus]